MYSSLTTNPLDPVPTPAVPASTVPDASSRELALAIARAADDRKGADIRVLQVDQVSYLADYFVFVTGFSKTQVRAITQAITNVTREQCGRSPLRIEGVTDASWIVMDYGDVIVHILLPREREYYNLEAFWGHGEVLDFAAPTGD